LLGRLAKPSDQLAHDVDDEIDVILLGAPVDDRRPKRDLPGIGGGAGEDPAVGEQRLADAAVELVQPVLRPALKQTMFSGTSARRSSSGASSTLACSKSASSTRASSMSWR